MNRSLLAAIFVASSLATPAAQANTFVSWEVANVDWDDVLNVRAWPSPQSAIRAGYPNGTALMMTGRCMNGVSLKDISAMALADQVEKVRFTWCEVWHDPADTGNWEPGWVYGRYIRPQ